METVRIAEQKALIVAWGAVHTVHVQRWLYVRNIHLCNVTAVDATVSVAICESGEAPSSTLALLYQFTLAGNEFIEFGEGILIPPSGTLYAAAGAINSINIRLSGEES